MFPLVSLTIVHVYLLLTYYVLLTEIIIFVICSLIKDAVNSSVYIASNDRMVTEEWIGKDMEGNGPSVLI
jgi:hypothetical protein